MMLSALGRGRKTPSPTLPLRVKHDSMQHLIYSVTSIFILLAVSVFQSSLQSMPRAEQEVLKVKVLSQGSSLEVLKFICTTFLAWKIFLCLIKCLEPFPQSV